MTMGPYSDGRHDKNYPRGRRVNRSAEDDAECTSRRLARGNTAHLCTNLVATAGAINGDKSSPIKHNGREHKKHVSAVGPNETGELSEEIACCEATEEIGSCAKNTRHHKL